LPKFSKGRIISILSPISIWMKTAFIKFLLIFTFLPFQLAGQQLNFRNYSVADGLAQSQVYAIAEDVSGNIWFGTRGGGLSQFDGINFHNYTVQDGLASNFINAILKDKKGNIWCGTDEGLSKYEGKKFNNYKPAQGLYSTKVKCLLEDNLGVIWIGTDKGIFQVDKDSIVRFGRKINAPMSPIHCLFQDHNGTVWAGTDFGLYHFSKEASQWTMKVYTVKDGLPGNIINSVKEDSGSLWICTYGGGVSKLYQNKFENYTIKDGLGSNTVFVAATNHKGSLWFGTASGASNYEVGDSNRAKPFTTYTDEEGLPGNAITAIFNDSFGDFWFGTSGGGVSKLDGKRFTHYPEIKGIMGQWVFSIFQDKDSTMWFGTSEGGVTSYDGNYYKRYSQKDNFTASKVKTIQQDKNGNIYFGTISDGAYQYDGKRFKHYSKKNGLSSNFINYIISDSLNRVWMATAGGGITVLNNDKRKISISHILSKHGLGSDRVNALLLDLNGNVWAATNDGVSCIAASDSLPLKITNFKLGKEKDDNQFRCLAMNKQGRIFMGTADAGVVYFDGKKLVSLDDENGIASKNIYLMIVDEDNQLWVGTEKGLDKIFFDSQGRVISVKHYGKEEGFIGIETIQNSVCKDYSGKLWFGSIKCATSYNPDFDIPASISKTRLTSIQLFFNPINKTEYGKNVKAWYPIPKELQLPYDQNHLSFQFIGIEQRNPEGVTYKWMLEGFDETWSRLSNRREAVYSNLPPGKYVFKVLSFNESGVASDIPEEFSFTIHPPYWRTWWFRSIIIVLFVALVWFIVFWRYKKIRIENGRERDRLAMERNLLELEQKALRLQMNPHFLFNSLNSIKGLISENKPEEAKIYLSKFSKLMRTMLDNSRQTFIPLYLEIEALKNYLELEKLSMGEQLKYFITYDAIDPELVLIPPMLLQPFVENSIVHGLAPKSGGTIHVVISRENNLIKCIIEDDGVGRVNSRKISEHKSNAIAITQERLNIINAKLSLEEIKIEFEDVIVAGEIQGTRVILRIPFIKD
jgi:ligand-binding sensor domain-containing protein